MRNIKRLFMKKLFARTFVVALGIIAAGAVVAWTGPTGTAPDNNAPAPINTTGTTQTKTGILSSGDSFVAPNMTANQFCIGTSCVTSWTQAGGSATWASITGKPYAFNQSADIGASPAFGGSLTVAGQSVCRADGTNCPAGAAPAWAAITGKPGNLAYWDTWYGSTYHASDGNIYLGWLGDWLSNRLNQAVTTNSTPQFGRVYDDNTAYYLDANSSSRLSTVNADAVTVGGQPVCLANGTNCPAGAAPAWASITGKPYAFNQSADVGASPTFGNVTATAFLYSSDQRLKDNITPIRGALAKIVELSGVNFSWKSGARAGQADVGVIAQEVQNVLPEAVNTDASGYLSVDYPKLVPLLIEAIKEQQSQISALKAEVDALRAGR